MMTRIVILLALSIGLLISTSGCGEKPCNRVGDYKHENGTSYYCRDHGSGPRWYPAS